MDNTRSGSFLLNTKLYMNPIITALMGTKKQNLEGKSALDPLGADVKKK